MSLTGRSNCRRTGGATTKSEYDSAGRVTKAIDGSTKTTLFRFNDIGEMTESVNPLTQTTKYEYDSGGRQTKSIDGLTKTTLFYFDDAGRQTKMVDPVSATTQYQFDSNNRMTKLIDPNLNTTSFNYDDVGNKTSQIDALTRTQSWAYDASNRITQTIDRNTRTAGFAYNDGGYLTSEIHYDSGGTATSTLTYTFNSNGDMLTAGNANGTYTMSYDDSGQVTQVVAPFGVTHNFAYDSEGHRTLVTGSLGGTTSSTYDDDGRLSRQTFTDGTKNLRMDLTYTANDQISTQVRFSDLGGTTTVAYSDYDYDDASRVTSIVHKDGSNNTIDSFAFTYNAAGRLTVEVRGTVTTNYGYDDSGQLTSDASSSYGYDAAGNRNSGSNTVTTANRLSSDGTWNFTYDNEGNLSRKDHVSTSYYWTYDYGNKNVSVR